MTRVCIHWFDDELSERDAHSEVATNRRQIADSVARRLSDDVEIVTIDTSDERIKKYVSDLNSGASAPPDILLIDLRLNSSREDISPSTWRTGKALAGMLSNESELLNVPCYLVSGVFDGQEQSSLIERDFDRIVKGRELADRAFDSMVKDGRDYRKLEACLRDFEWGKHSVKEEHVVAVAGLLSAPEEVFAELKTLLTHHLSRLLQNLVEFDTDGVEQQRSLKLPLSRFFRHIFLLRNGLLVSTDFLSILLGVTPEYFRDRLQVDLTDEFERAHYRGVFRNEWSDRWWRSAVIEALLNKFDDLQFVSSRGAFAQNVAATLKVPDEHRAKCAKCGELWPETLAQYASDDESWHPVHFRCGESMLGTGIPGFEDLYLYSD